MFVSQLDMRSDANAAPAQSSSSRDFTWKTAELPAVQHFEYTPSKSKFEGVSQNAATYSNPGVPEAVPKVRLWA